MMSAAKRTREDDDQIVGPDDSSPNPPLSLLLASLLACDPKEIAQQARQCDDETLSKLKAFTRSLGGELDKISSERREEIAKRAKQEKQYETAKKLGCSECKTKEEGELKFCAAISDRSCCKDSSVFCDACYQKRKANLKFCAECKLIICNKCQEEKWGKCCYEVWDMTTSSYVTCPNIFCGDCSLKVDYFNCDTWRYLGNGRGEQCNSWYCSEHKGKVQQTRECYECGKREQVCNFCDEDEYCANCAANYFN